jgi:4-hydroxybenzoate polyprenyltransferase
MLKALIKTMRPRQWPKNGFIFFGLIFDKRLFEFEPLSRTIAGFFLFCLISSAVYLFNDVADVEADRNHPEKKYRPVASGQLSVNVALAAALLLVIIVLPLAYLLSPLFALFIAVYFANNVLYSRWLKHVSILDVLILSSGFVLRVAGGVALILPVQQRFSPWLYMITVLFSLYIVLGKRRAELNLLAQGASAHRRVFDGYTIPLLDQYITIVSGMTIVAYSLYTFSAPSLPANHTMMFTIPFVVYGIFRYLQLIQVGHAAGAPDEVALRDRPLQVTVLLWGLAVIAILYFS